MKKPFSNILILFLCGLAMSACQRKDPDPLPAPAITGILNLNIETDINGNQLMMNTGKYVNANGDSFSVSTLKYYISNIILKNSDGSIYKVPDSYYLLDASVNTDTIISIRQVPAGTYTEIGFSLGVDSINNHTGSQPAALNPTIAGDMFWSWAPGYKFMEFEGHYGAGNAGMLFHISGDNNYKKWLMNSTRSAWTNINIKDNAVSAVNMKANFDEMFKTPVTINFSTTNSVSGGTDAQIIANNYADMFELSGIVNP
jgi:hypothetical protein